MLLDPTVMLRPRRFFDKPIRGIVVDNEDPLKLRRVRCQIPPFIVGKKEWLPWITCGTEHGWGGGHAYAGGTDIPIKDAELTIEFPYGPYQPVYTGYWHTKSTVQGVFEVDYPHTYGKRDRLGSFFRTNMVEEYTEYVHTSGSYVRFTKEGDIEFHAARDMITWVERDHKTIVKGKREHFVGGNNREHVMGSERVLINGTQFVDAATITLNGPGPPAARVGDPTDVRSGKHSHLIAAGSATVFIGDSGSPGIGPEEFEPVVEPEERKPD